MLFASTTLYKNTKIKHQNSQQHSPQTSIKTISRSTIDRSVTTKSQNEKTLTNQTKITLTKFANATVLRISDGRYFHNLWHTIFLMGWPWPIPVLEWLHHYRNALFYGVKGIVVYLYVNWNSFGLFQVDWCKPKFYLFVCFGPHYTSNKPILNENFFFRPICFSHSANLYFIDVQIIFSEMFYTISENIIQNLFQLGNPWVLSLNYSNFVSKSFGT
jgi:hypothetical protein